MFTRTELEVKSLRALRDYTIRDTGNALNDELTTGQNPYKK
ncbi:MAG: hypothetical protein V7K38_15110 [Nostoc sp.]